uniref:Calpain 10 n=1 Tax=Cyprinus carpio TaxID=7962 RepID=A0A8C2KDM2_CYPCA
SGVPLGGAPAHHGMFVDPDFPAEESSLFCDYTTPLPKLLGDVTWLRPQEICKQPQLFPDDPVEAHPKQGILGDCWLLCACSMLLKNQHLLNKVFPPEQPLWGDRVYHGEFRVQFWQNGRWIEVRVDDQLPCVNDTLCFSRCQSPRAFWVALLEKAYAKLHGSYERLWAGQVCEAVVDLSGTIAVRWSLKGTESSQQPKDSQTQHTPNGMRLSELSLELKERCAISCCVHSFVAGIPELGQYHAMSVMEWTNVTTTTGEQVELIRIRNPWGRRSWNGVWRERYGPSCSQALLGRTAEGEFWMDETEFQQEFDEVTVGCPLSETGHLQSIYTGSYLTHSHQIGGRWVKGHSAGGCRNNNTFSINPKFWLKVCERGEVLLSLLQYGHPEPPAEGRTQQHSHLQAIALHVWKVPDGDSLLSPGAMSPVVSCVPHAHSQEVSVFCHLQPGKYIIIPSTYQPELSAHFTLTFTCRINR